MNRKTRDLIRARQAASLATRRNAPRAPAREELPEAPPRGCEHIAGDPILEIRAGRNPHCGEPVEPGEAYCAEHVALCYTNPSGRMMTRPPA